MTPSRPVRLLDAVEARVLTDAVKRDATALWQTLQQLHDGGAHLVLGYPSWQAFCRAEFDLGKSRAYQLLAAAHVVEAVHNCGLAAPKNESQARQLVPLLEDERQLVDTWRELQEAHGDRLSAAVVGQAVARTLAAEQKRVVSGRSADLRLAREAADAAAPPGRPLFRLGDSRELIGELADGSVALVLTDPPYGINYQGRPYYFQDGQITGDQTPEQAAALLAEMLELIRPKLAEQTHLLVFTSPVHDPVTRAVIDDAGFRLRSNLVWVKNGHGVGDCTHTFGPQHECIVHASTGNAPMRRRIGDVFTYPRVRQHLHQTQKPVQLLAELIRATTNPGALVVDPFAGLASTLVAATISGRDSYGCELDPGHHQHGLDRLGNLDRDDTTEAA